MTWIVLILVSLAAILDLRSREIPDWIPIAVGAVGVLGLGLGLDERQWLSSGILLVSVFGVASLLFAAGGLGGGDVKLITSLAVAFPVVTFVLACFYGALAGGVLALVAKLRGEEEIAYGPAIAIGFLLAVLMPREFLSEMWGAA